MPRKTTCKPKKACGPKKTKCKPKTKKCLSLFCNEKGFAGPNPTIFKYILAVLAFLVVIMTAFYVGLIVGRVLIPTPTGDLNTFQSGWDAANKKMIESGVVAEETEEVNSIRGIVEDINGDTLMITANQVVSNPLGTPAPTEREIIISKDAKIVKRTEKPFEQVMAEEEAYFRSIENLSEDQEAPAPPLSYTEEVITTDGIRAGDRIRITSEENIKYVTKFTASEVIITVSAELEDEIEEIE